MFKKGRVFASYDLGSVHDWIFRYEVPAVFDDDRNLINSQAFFAFYENDYCDLYLRNFFNSLHFSSVDRPVCAGALRSILLSFYKICSYQLRVFHDKSFFRNFLLSDQQVFLLFYDSVLLTMRENNFDFSFLLDDKKIIYQFLAYYFNLKMKLPVFDFDSFDCEKYFQYINSGVYSYLQNDLPRFGDDQNYFFRLIVFNYEIIKSRYFLFDYFDLLQILLYLIRNYNIDFGFLHCFYVFAVDFLSPLEIDLFEILSKKNVSWNMTIFYDSSRSFLFSSANDLIYDFKFRDICDFVDIDNLRNDLFSERIFANDFKQNNTNINFKKNITLLNTLFVEDEIDRVCRKINFMIKEDESISYKDIAIIFPNVSNYFDLISSKMRDFDIPACFYVYRNLMDFNVVSAAMMILEIVIGGMSLEVIIRFLSLNYVFIDIDSFGEEFKRIFSILYDHDNTNVIVDRIGYYYSRMHSFDGDFIEYLKTCSDFFLKKDSVFYKNQIFEIRLCILYIDYVIDIFSSFKNFTGNIFDFAFNFKNLILNKFHFLENINLIEDDFILHDTLGQFNCFIQKLDDFVFDQSFFGFDLINIDDFYSSFSYYISEIFSFFDRDLIVGNGIHIFSSKFPRALRYEFVFVLGFYDKGIFSFDDIKTVSSSCFFANYSFCLHDNFNKDVEIFYVLNSFSKKLFLSYPESDGISQNDISHYFDDICFFYGDVELWEDFDLDYNCFDNFNALALEYSKGNFDLGNIDFDGFRQKFNISLYSDKDILMFLSKMDCELSRNDSKSFGVYEGVLNEDLSDVFPRFNPSMLDRYGGCPHKFFYYDVLNLRGAYDDGFIRFADIGNLIHRSLYVFYSSYYFKGGCDEYFYGDLFAIVEFVLGKVILEYDFGDLDKFIYFVGRSFDSLVYRISSFIFFDLNKNKNFSPLYLEYRFDDLQLSFKKRKLIFDGVIDRVDISHDCSNIRVIDYKTGYLPSNKKIKKLIIQGFLFQPFIYYAKTFEFIKNHSIEFYYYNINLNFFKLVDLGFSFDDFVFGSDLTYFDLMRYYVLLFAENIYKGIFPVNPRVCLDYCEFKHKVCRVDTLLSEDKESNVRFWKNINDILDFTKFNDKK